MMRFDPVAPFAGLTGLGCDGAGLRVSTRNNLAIASVLPRKNQEAALAERIQRHFGLRLPSTTARAHAGGTAFIATGPQAWLATCESGGVAFPASLRQVCGDLASISDQSDGYAVLRLAGPKVRETLAKLVPIDVHPRAFPVETAVVTVAANIGATMWRVADETDGSAAFELAIYRSMAGAFWHVTCESAAEFGLTVTDTERAHTTTRAPAHAQRDPLAT